MRPVDFKPRHFDGLWISAPLTAEAEAHQSELEVLTPGELDAYVHALLDLGFRVELNLEEVSE